MAAGTTNKNDMTEIERRLRDAVAAVADRPTLDLDDEPLHDVWLFALATKVVAASDLERALAGDGWCVVRLSGPHSGKVSKGAGVGAFWLASRDRTAAALQQLAKDKHALAQALQAGDVAGFTIGAEGDFDYEDYLVYEIDEDGRDETFETMRRELPAAVVDFVLAARTRYQFFDVHDHAFARTAIRKLGLLCGGVLMSSDDARCHVMLVD